jgi:hypothetical protein
MKAAGFDQEALDLVEKAMAANLSPAALAAAQRDEELRQRAAIKREREELLALADKTIEGKYGPEGVQLTKDLLSEAEGGRSDFNLKRLRTAIRKLR